MNGMISIWKPKLTLRKNNFLIKRHYAYITLNTMKKTLTSLFWILIVGLLQAQYRPILVKDINQGSADGLPIYGLSNKSVEAPAALGNFVIFPASDGSNGIELWISDGSSEGTFMLKDINPDGDSSPKGLYTWNGKTYFSAQNTEFGSELWVTDGTPEGTQILKDIDEGQGGSEPFDFTEWEGKLLFSAKTQATGWEIWITDGTADGTKLFKDVVPGSGDSGARFFKPTESGGFFFLSGQFADKDLWYCKGHQDSIQLLASEIIMLFGNEPEAMVFKDQLIFAGKRNGSFNYEPWISDGTISGTKILKEIVAGSSGSYPQFFTPFGDKVFFGADNGTWLSDGTSQGTEKIASVNLVPYQQIKNWITEINGKLIFPGSIRGFFGGNEVELYISDGTAQGTRLLKDINPGGGHSDPNNLIKVRDKIFFVATASSFINNELYVTDGTPQGTFALPEINQAGSANPSGFVAVNDLLFFSATNGSLGNELYMISLINGIKNLNLVNNLIQVFPNPVSILSEFQIQIKLPIDQLVITNLIGQTIQIIEAGDIGLLRKNLPRGTYYIKAVKDTDVQIVKVLVE